MLRSGWLKIRNTPLKYPYRIWCILKDHQHNEEILIDEYNTLHFCRCGSGVGTEWHIPYKEVLRTFDLWTKDSSR